MSATRRVHLLRHGAPARPGRFLGHADVPATAAGIAACRAAAEGCAYVHLVSSDLSRASVCAAAIGAPVRIDPRWRELDFGTWDGCDSGEIDPAARARFWSDPDGHPPPGGERWSALVGRVAAALDALEDESLVVTHAGAMRAALAAACGLDACQVWAFDLPYAGVLSLSLWREGDATGGQVTGLRT